MHRLMPTDRRFIRPDDKPSFAHTQRWGLNRRHPFAEGLVGSWLFNELGGGHSLDLITDLSGPITGMTWNADGIYNSVADSRIVVPHHANYNISARWTVIAKVYPETSTASAYPRLLQKGAASANRYVIYWNESNDHWYITKDGTDYSLFSAAVTKDTWQTVAFVYDGTKFYFYRDGKFIQTINGVAFQTNTEDLILFNRADNTREWYGGCEYLYIFNEDLSSDVIADIYAEPYGMFQQPARTQFYDVAAAGVEVSATLDTLILTEYAATINAKINFTAGLDTLVLTEYNADVNLNVSVSAVVDILVLTEYNPTVLAPIPVAATVDTLVITEYNADVNLNVSVSANVDTLILTEHNTVVNKEITFTAGLDALIITEYAADVNIDINVSASLDALIITEYNPTISVSDDIVVTAGVDSLILTEYAAVVNAEVSFTAGLDTLILTEYNANVNTEIDLTAGLDALILTEYAATVNAEVMFTAGLDALLLSEYAASVTLAAVWTSITIQGVDAISGEPVYIIGKYK